MSFSKFDNKLQSTRQKMDQKFTSINQETQDYNTAIQTHCQEGSNLPGTPSPQDQLPQTQFDNQPGTSTSPPPGLLPQTQGDNSSKASTAATPLQGCLPQSKRFFDDDIEIEETNYLRLIRLLFGIATKAVRVMFSYHLSGSLKTLLANKRNDLNKLRERSKIFQEQWQLVFPTNGSPKLERFDLSLLITLLQNLDIIDKPASGWQKLPKSNDHSEGADLVRIKLYRNQIVHHDKPCISNRDYKILWDDLSKAINRISNNVYDYEINHLRIQSLDRTQIDFDREFVQAKKQLNSTPKIHNISIQHWFEDRLTFVETRAAVAVKNTLSCTKFVVIAGDSGSGKSSIAHFYSLVLKEEGYTIIPIMSLEDITRIWSCDIKQVFVFDDPFGKNKIDESEMIKWQRFTTILKDVLEDENTKIVATTRKHIAKDSQFIIFSKGLKSEIDLEILDISKEPFLLSADEKKDIFEKHMKHYNKQVACETSVTECSLTCFPLLCSLFAKDIQPEVSMEEFFKSPYSVFQKELEDLMNYSKLKYFSLLLCVIYDNNLDIEFIDKVFQDKKEKTKIKAFLTHCGLSTAQSQHEICSALDSLVGTYLIKDEDTSLYKFVHDFIFDTIVANLPIVFHKSIIEYCPSKFIRERIRFKSMSVSKEERKTCILLEEDKINTWVDRLFDDIKRKHVYDVFFNPCLQEPHIEQAFAEHLDKKSESEKILIAYRTDEWSFEEISLSYSATNPTASFNEQYRYNLESLIFGLLQEEECTVLHWAVARRLLKIFDVMWDISGYKETNDISITLFLLACFSGSAELTEGLIKKGGNVQQANHDGITPIYAAAYNGSDEVARILFENGAQLTGQERKRSKPLIVASYNGHENMVKQLINKGASINDQDSYGWSPIYAASLNGHEYIVNILIENGASVDILNNKCMTPLIAAASNGHVGVIQLLLSKGADPKKTSIYGRSAVYEAAYIGHTAVLNVLLTESTENLVNRQDENKCTPLHAACNKGHYDSVEILLKHKASINLQDNNGCTPLFLAASMGHGNVVELLLKNGAYVEQCDDDGWSPLFAAAMSGQLSVTKILLQHHANVNVSTGDSESSPLMEASLQGHFQIVKILLDAKADVNARDRYGCTPLYNASVKGNKEIVRLLREYGADDNNSDNDF